MNDDVIGAKSDPLEARKMGVKQRIRDSRNEKL
jgi:hypothetical protein